MEDLSVAGQLDLGQYLAAHKDEIIKAGKAIVFAERFTGKDSESPAALLEQAAPSIQEEYKHFVARNGDLGFIPYAEFAYLKDADETLNYWGIDTDLRHLMLIKRWVREHHVLPREVKHLLNSATPNPGWPVNEYDAQLSKLYAVLKEKQSPMAQQSMEGPFGVDFMRSFMTLADAFRRQRETLVETTQDVTGNRRDRFFDEMLRASGQEERMRIFTEHSNLAAAYGQRNDQAANDVLTSARDFFDEVIREGKL